MKAHAASANPDGSGSKSIGEPQRNWAMLISLALLPVLLLAGFFRWHQRAARVGTVRAKLALCEQHMRIIYDALQAYRRDHGGKYPASLTQFVLPPGEIYLKLYGRREWPGLYPAYIKDASVFRCPDDPGPGLSAPQMIHRSYMYGPQLSVIGPKWMRDQAEQLLYQSTIPAEGGRMILLECPFHRSLARPWWAHLVLRANGAIGWYRAKPGPQAAAR